MAARFPDWLYTKINNSSKYYFSARNSRGRFASAGSMDALDYVAKRLGTSSEFIVSHLTTNALRASREWVNTRLVPGNVPFYTGNLLASSGVILSSYEAQRAFHANAPKNFSNMKGKHKTAFRRQKWGLPQKGSGWGVDYWRAVPKRTNESPYYMSTDINKLWYAGIMNPTHEYSVSAVLVSAIPYASPLNDGSMRGHVHKGWFTRLALDFGRYMMAATCKGGYTIDAQIIELLKQKGGLATSVNL